MTPPFSSGNTISKEEARLKLLKEKGMQVEENPDITTFRVKVADIQNMDLYEDPKVQSLLIKILDATK